MDTGDAVEGAAAGPGPRTDPDPAAAADGTRPLDSGEAVGRVVLAVFLLVGGLLTVPLVGVGLMGTDNCPSGDGSGICSVARQQFVVHFAGIGTLVTVAFGIVGMIHPRRGLVLGLLGLLGLFGVWATTAALM